MIQFTELLKTCEQWNTYDKKIIVKELFFIVKKWNCEHKMSTPLFPLENFVFVSYDLFTVCEDGFRA